MKAIEDIQRFADQWISYLSACLSLPMNAPACKPLWQWTMIVIFIVGAWLLIAIVWKIGGDVIRMRRLRRQIAELEARAPEEIRRARWIGDDVYTGSDAEDMEKQIRNAVDRNRANH